MSKKALNPLIITRSEPIPISQKMLQKTPNIPIISKSAPGSYYGDFFVGSPRSGLDFEQSKKCEILLRDLSEDTPVDEPKDSVSTLSGELSHEKEIS